MTGYIKKIIDYFSFVNRRRLDARFPIFSPMPVLVVGLLVFLGLVLAFIWVVDPVFLADMQRPDWKRNEFFESITDLGNSNWLLISTGIVLIILSVLTADRFEGAKHMIWHRLFLYAYFLFTTVLYSGVVVNIFKLAFGRTRPHYSQGIDTWQPMSFGDIFINGSFPSGHATTAGALAIALGLLFPKFRWLLIAGFTLAIISRPSIGKHYPSDVLAGSFFGAIFTYYYARFFARKRLLFTFSEKGDLTLRGEGRGKMGQLGAMIKEGIKSL
ncbi:MAG: phosphatase PAP2 family protein [Rhizobiaceae bacterium]|nr:phosphatase PAP2 family protein [Rhizobiaceae bacterium]